MMCGVAERLFDELTAGRPTVSPLGSELFRGRYVPSITYQAICVGEHTVAGERRTVYVQPGIHIGHDDSVEFRQLKVAIPNSPEAATEHLWDQNSTSFGTFSASANLAGEPLQSDWDRLGDFVALLQDTLIATQNPQ